MAAITAATYFYLDLQGECSIPSREESLSLRRNGIVPVFQLDANICLHLVRIGDGRESLKVLPKTHHMLVAAQLSGIDLLASIGLIELCLEPRTLTIDSNEYDRKGSAILNAFDCDVACYEGLAAPSRARKPIEGESPEALRAAFLILYGNMLKVRLLTRRGLSQEWAHRNIFDFVRWSNRELRVISNLGLQVAFAIFGGDSAARRLLRIDEKSTEDRDAAWTAAWDLMHVMLMQRASVVPLNGLQNRPIFVTDDRALFGIASKYAVRALIRNDQESHSIIGEVSYDYPHFRRNFSSLHRLELEMKREQLERISSGPKVGAEHVSETVRRLEAEVCRN